LESIVSLSATFQQGTQPALHLYLPPYLMSTPNWSWVRFSFRRSLCGGGELSANYCGTMRTRVNV